MTAVCHMFGGAQTLFLMLWIATGSLCEKCYTIPSTWLIVTPCVYYNDTVEISRVESLYCRNTEFTNIFTVFFLSLVHSLQIRSRCCRKAFRLHKNRELLERLKETVYRCELDSGGSGEGLLEGVLMRTWWWTFGVHKARKLIGHLNINLSGNVLKCCTGHALVHRHKFYCHHSGSYTYVSPVVPLLKISQTTSNWRA